MEDRVSILIVDDIKENHLVMESVLELDTELHIVKAYSGEEALSLCMSHDFAVIFMDVQMPGLDGFETAELLRGIEKTKHIPIIFVTAINKEKLSVFKGYEVGAVDYLSKPIDPLVLRSKTRVFKEMYLQKQVIQAQAKSLEDKLRELLRIQEEKEELEHIAEEDSLTKILNRRGVEKRSAIHWKNCIRYSLPFSVLMLDLDRYKGYNDNYGHVEGDQVLIKIAKAIEDSLFRAEDFVGRYGGEEFIVIMPNTDKTGALVAAKRIEKKVRKLSILHEYNGEHGIATVSMGVASKRPVKGDDIKALINKADEQMYLAKENGRNQIKYAD